MTVTPREVLVTRVQRLYHRQNTLSLTPFLSQIGINPGMYAAWKGHHYAGPGNHFCKRRKSKYEETVIPMPFAGKCLFLSGLIPKPMSADDDRKCLNHGIGFTNIVERTTRGSANLTRSEILDGTAKLMEKIKTFRPKVAVFNGKGIYEVFSGNKDFHFGKQPDVIEGTETVSTCGDRAKI